MERAGLEMAIWELSPADDWKPWVGMKVLRERVWTSYILTMHQNHLWTFQNYPRLGPTPDLNQNFGVGMCNVSNLHR